MPDIGYAVGTEDANGNFVEHGRFNNKTSSVADPVLLEHADSGNTAELGSDRLEVTGADLRLDTGQSIEDGSGTSRLEFNSNGTNINSAQDDSAIVLVRGNKMEVSAFPAAPLRIRDREGDFDAVQYDTGASQGTLSLLNADLDMSGNIITGNSGELSLSGGGSNERVVARLNKGTSTDAFVVNDVVNGNDSIVMERTGLVDIRKGNLRLATGRAIEDDSGSRRVLLSNNATLLYDNVAHAAMYYEDGDRYRVRPKSNTPWVIEDSEGNYNAVEYSTSASAPGTLELSNAQIDASADGYTHVFGSTADTGNGIIKISSSGSRVDLQFETSDDGLGRLFMENGELKFTDPSGTTTTIA